MSPEKKMKKMKKGAKKVLVAGGGIAGLKAAFELVESGVEVVLVERDSSIGGSLSQLDRWFPDNACNLCQILPPLGGANDFCLRASFHHPRIEVVTSAGIDKIDGSFGDFTVHVTRRATGVDRERCITCDECVQVCPVEVDDEYEETLRKRKAIHVRYPQATPLNYVVDWEHCTRCGECVKVCPTKAVNLDDKDETLRFKVHSVILSSGFVDADPCENAALSFASYPDVVTSVQLERLQSWSRTQHGAGRLMDLRRPSDGEIPRSIAFIQCVGSRDKDHPYCSAACCMFALKEAILLREFAPQIECTIFYMDIRASGKYYEEYFDRAKELGVKFIRCRIPEVKEDEEGLLLCYEMEDGGVEESHYDMVALSTGFHPPAAATKFAESIGIASDEFGFFGADPLTGETTRSGIYACGCAVEPRDIPDSVLDSARVAAEVMFRLGAGSGIETAHEKTPDPEIFRAEPRIGIFLCSCGQDRSRYFLDSENDLVEFCRSIPDVRFVTVEDAICLPEKIAGFVDVLEKENLNRILLAACSPRLIESHFGDVLAGRGIPREFLEVVNLREQCYWTHLCSGVDPSLREKGRVLAKMKNLIGMAAAKLGIQELTPLPRLETGEKAVLVVGAGPAGLTTAFSLAEAGVAVTLVEREEELAARYGGLAIPELGGIVPSKMLTELVDRVKGHENVDLHLASLVKESSGSAGAYRSAIAGLSSGEERVLEHGALIIATGASEHRPEEYLLGESTNVITQEELQGMLGEKDFSPGTVVMILCAGSREAPRGFCSRTCCTKSIRNALAIMERNPEAAIYILYRDIRTIGFRELYYREARERGIVFISYEPDRKPSVSVGEEGLSLTVTDPIVEEELVINPDYLVLSPGIEHPYAGEIAETFDLALDSHGFVVEENVKFRPFDTVRKGGIFVCGSAVRPCYFEEAVASGKVAAGRALSLLSRPEHRISRGVAIVKEKWCSGCEACIPLCPYSARVFDEVARIAVVDETACRGCGACVAACPGGATELRTLTGRQVFRMLEKAFA